MRAFLLSTLFAVTLLAGCSDSSSEPLDANLAAPIQLRYLAPGALYANETVMNSFVVPTAIVTGEDLCSGPTVTCFEYTFSINQTQAFRTIDGVETAVEGTFAPGNETGVNVTAAAPITVEAVLTWPMSSDFDLYLYAGTDRATAIAQSANDPAADPVTQSEQFTAELVEGDYTVVVVAWAVAQDTFSLAVTFPTA